MRHISLAPTMGTMVVFLFIGCGLIPQPQPTPDEAPPRQPAKIERAPRPVGSYYYFTEAQIKKKQGKLDEAILFLQQAIASDPEAAYLEKELAGLYLLRKEPERALAIVEGLKRKKPKDVDTLIMYGRIKQDLQDNESAAKAYRRVLELDPSQERIYLLLGSIYRGEERIDEALELYQRMVATFPESYAGHFYLGKLNAQTGDVQAAEAEFLRSLELEPDLEEARFELLNLYEGAGETSRRYRIYEELLERNPENVRAQLGLGYLYYQEGRHQEAQNLFEDLGRQSIADSGVFRKVVQLYLDTRRYSQAVVILEGMLQAVPDNADLHYLAGIARDNTGDKQAAIGHLTRVTPGSRFFENASVHAALLYQELDQAENGVALLEKAVVAMPQSAQFFLYLGSLQEQLEQYDRALGSLQRGLTIDPQNAKLLFRLAVVFDKAGRKQECIATLEQVIALEPDNASALNYLGYTYVDLGENLDEAERLIETALQYKPDDGYITDSLGWLYFKKGQFKKALRLLLKASRLAPDDPVILEHLGDAYLKTGDRQNALNAYRQSLQKKEGGDTADIERKIRELNAAP